MTVHKSLDCASGNLTLTGRLHSKRSNWKSSIGRVLSVRVFLNVSSDDPLVVRPCASAMIVIGDRLR
jgi:hypothetical protein